MRGREDNHNTPLHAAVEANDLDAISDLLEQGVNDIRDHEGFTAMELALELGYEECAIKLLQNRKYDLGSMTDAHQNTLLHMVAESDNTDLAKALIENGADILQQNQLGVSACDIAIHSDNVDMVKLMIDNIPDINGIINNDSDTLLTAAINNNDEDLVMLVLENKANPDIYYAGDPPLLLAAAKGNLDIVTALVKHGADVTVTNKNKTTALHRAAYEDNASVVDELILAGADFNAVNKEGRTPLHYAAMNGSIDAAHELLSHNQIDINVQDAQGRTAAHLAYMYDNIDLLQILALSGADLNRKDDKGNTVLHLAVQNGDITLIPEFIKFGADIHQPNNEGVSPLQLASQLNIPNVTSLFLHKGQIAPQTIHTIDEYIDYTLRQKNSHQVDTSGRNKKIMKFGLDLTRSLSGSDSDLSKAIFKMNDNDKSRLIAAIIVNDKNYLKELFSKYPFSGFINKYGHKLNDIKYLTQHTNPDKAKEKRFWISPVAQIFMQYLFLKPDGAPISQHNQLKLVTEAFSSIPDDRISLYAKKEISKNISTKLDHIRVAYNEFQKPLDSHKSTGIIKPVEYKNLLSLGENKITQSDFILLTTGVLQSFAGQHEEMASSLRHVRQYYASTDYASAVNELNKVADSYKSIIGDELSGLIQHGANQFKLVDTENFSRRFFENRYAGLYQGMKDNLVSVNRILNHFSLDSAKNPEEMAKQISLLGEYDDKSCFIRMDELKLQTTLYQRDIRQSKGNFYSKQGESSTGEIGDSVYSSNVGVMTSNQPAYYDERSRHPLRNSPSDIVIPNKSYEHHEKFAKGSFVAGVSGHAYFLVAILEKYATENKHSNTLNDDINRFIHSLMAAYVSRGYHGMIEVLAVFEQPNIKELFEKNFGVIISTQTDDKVLDSAFRDAQTYTATLLKRSQVNQEIQQRQGVSSAGSTFFHHRKSKTLDKKEAVDNKVNQPKNR